MKKRVTVLICIIFVTFCSLSSSGIFVDGHNNDTVWNVVDLNILFDSTAQSKCDVEYADIRVVLENKNTVSIFFQAIDLSFNERVSAVRFGINGSFYTLTADGKSNYSNVEYSVNAESTKYNHDYILEATIVLSGTVTSGTEMSVIVTDGKGISSPRRNVKIYSIYQQETTSKTVKTTAPKTTAPKTTIPKTTKAPKTTVPKPTKPPKTTVPKDTKPPKTTKAPKTTKPKAISSGSTKKSTRKSFWNIIAGNEYDNTQVEEYIASEYNDGEQPAETESPQFDLTEDNIQTPQRYKYLVGALVFLLLISAAIIMMIPTLRKKEKSDSQIKNKEDNK